jgi:mannose-6-phosphate isomerase-like protein (cupin superfamily)
MRLKIGTRFVLVSLLALTAVCIAAQARGQGGRGTPQPLSTDPYNIWSGQQLTTPGNLGNYGHYSASIQRRAVGAAPETHDGFSHFLMFTSGEGNFILGGQIVDGPDGKKMIKGGDTQKIVVGAMYHVPIKTPHQVVPNPGTSVTYWVTNINVPKP